MPKYFWSSFVCHGKVLLFLFFIFCYIGPCALYNVLKRSLILLCVRMDLLVRATCKVVPLESLLSSTFWYVYERWSSLSVSRLVLFR